MVESWPHPRSFPRWRCAARGRERGLPPSPLPEGKGKSACGLHLRSPSLEGWAGGWVSLGLCRVLGVDVYVPDSEVAAPGGGSAFANAQINANGDIRAPQIAFELRE